MITMLNLVASTVRASAISIILLLSAVNAFSQNRFSDNVTLDELSMKTYEKDSTADAVCLFDLGDLRIDNGTILTIHYRIKILKKTDYSNYADIVIISERNTLQKLQASTYNLINGQIVRSDVKEDGIHHVKDGKNTERITVAMPNVVEGSVIDVSYSLRWLDYRMIRWEFQRDIPVKWSEYKFTNWKFSYLIDYRGAPKFTVNESTKKDRVQQWVMTDVPAFKPEPMMLDENVYRMSVNFWRPNERWEQIVDYFARLQVVWSHPAE